MNKNLLLFVLLLVSGAKLKANPLADSLKTTYNPDSSYLQENFVSLNLILPGISFEKKIGKTSTLCVSAGIIGTRTKDDVRTGNQRFVTIKTYVNL